MLKLNQFFIKEHVGLFKLSNAYDIINPETGVVVGLAQEKPGGLIQFLRLFIDKRMLPTRVDVIDGPDDEGNGKTVFSIKRGFTLINSKIRVFVDGDSEVGYFKAKFFSLGGGFWVYDSKRVKVAEIKGDWRGWNFKLLDVSGKEIGLVTKKWAGLGKEMLTSADNYMVSLSGVTDGANLGEKALLLAACIAIDTVYKEK